MLFSFEEGPMLHHGQVVYVGQEYALNFVLHYLYKRC